MINRRQLIQMSASALACSAMGAAAVTAAEGSSTPIRRAMPGSGELLPVIGMGTSRTFDTGGDAQSLAHLSQVMQVFFDGQGSVVDSSPMYGEAESRVGDVLRAMPDKPNVFAATKVWTTGKEAGIAQMEQSARRMGVETFHLIAVHNLVDWKTQLKTLKQWKDKGKVRYIGITTSHGRHHQQFLQVMRSEPLDFVQFSYNIEDRVAEQQLLPLAQERGIATMINRPFQRGALFGKSRGKDLPGVARDLGCGSWGQFYLKFIMGHPAATCVIPATSKVHHMRDNMQAGFGLLPDERQRAEMLQVFQSL